jgi:hypothetical protein
MYSAAAPARKAATSATSSGRPTRPTGVAGADLLDPLLALVEVYGAVGLRVLAWISTDRN